MPPSLKSARFSRCWASALQIVNINQDPTAARYMLSSNQRPQKASLGTRTAPRGSRISGKAVQEGDIPLRRQARSRPFFWPDTAGVRLQEDSPGLPCIMERQPCISPFLDWLLRSGMGTAACRAGPAAGSGD